ncbi:MAG: selenocysteine-specific translation elongation factor [Burkholderiales bacterium]|nr:selenocysteine-specific translation elongation factor [Burkholderiales bacterium]
MLVATAGHIDHGKTRLVKALTGVDTDRLPEEKARGISIDLGFAYWALEDGRLLGFVDVPGHERFIHNMLAGVAGVDFALLAVAADDGVMPQTVEHVQILGLLGVPRGAVALTKIDRADPARRARVEADVRGLLEGTPLAGSPVLPVCAPSGEGLERLRETLRAAARAHAERYREGQHFRLAVDRAFAVAGSGTVATGTVFNGEVRAGDQVVVSPAGARARVRALQVRGRAVERAQAGERCALNLGGVRVEAVARGDWVLHEAIHAPSCRLDVRLALLAAERAPLAHWTAVHLHLGTADVRARVAIRRGAKLAPGATALVQLVTERPVGALAGDRFILRDASAGRTLGGGRVVDPLAPRPRGGLAARVAELAALEIEPVEAALAQLLAIPERALDCRHFETIRNLTPARAAALYRAARAETLGREARVAVPGARLEALRAQARERLAGFHRAQPRAAGLPEEALRKEVAPWLVREAWGHVLRGLAQAREIVSEGAILRLAGHDPTANAADRELWLAVQPALAREGLVPPSVPELARRLGVGEKALRDFLHRKSAGGDPVHLGEDRFVPRAVLAVHAANAALVARMASRGLFTAAQFRDATGVGRNLAIRILEYLDTLGVTQRIGDARKMHKDFVPLLGPAKPSFRQPPRPPTRS